MEQRLSLRVRIALIFGVWTLLCALAASQSALTSRLEGQPSSFWNNFTHFYPAYLLWALATPGIFWLGRRCPPLGASWLRNAFLHLLAAALFAGVHRPVLVGIGWLPMSQAAPEEQWKFLLVWVAVTFYIDILVYGLVLAVGIIGDAFLRERDRLLHTARLEQQLAQARLRGLQMQLRPHFFFNTLHAVGALVRTDRKREAVEMVTGLGSLMRRVLEEDGRAEVRLEEELDFIRDYLEIEGIRFQDRLQTYIQVAEEVRDALVPNLILQPLVENAIQHGVARRSGPGHVEIRARKGGERLILEVRDDGPGVTAPLAAKEGIGLGNVRARLAELYGAEHSLELLSEGGGTVARVTLPFRLAIGELAEPA